MSNPAVVKLQKKKIADDKMWMDDNFGESVHLHINDFRVDMTIKEFAGLYDETCQVLNQLIDVKGFDAANIDPVFLECMLWKDLLHLKEVRIDEVKLSDLLVAGKPIKPLGKSKFMKAALGNHSADSKSKPSDHYGQSRKQRMESVNNVVAEKGYPYDEKYIILYGDDNVIQDGQHRAAALLREGDRVIPVQRFYFDNYKPVNLKFQMNPIGSKIYHIGFIIRNLKGPIDFIKKLKRQVKPTILLIIKKYKDVSRKWYGFIHKNEIKQAKEVLGNK